MNSRKESAIAHYTNVKKIIPIFLSTLLFASVVYAETLPISLEDYSAGDTIYAKPTDSITTEKSELVIKDGEETVDTVTTFPYELSKLSEKTYTIGDNSLCIDATQPEVTIDGVEAGNAYKTANIKVKATDTNIKSTNIELNEEKKEKEFTVTEDGSYTLKVTAEDKAGNKTVKVVKFTVCNVAPLIEVTGLDKNIQNTNYNIKAKITSSLTTKETVTLKKDDDEISSSKIKDGITLSEEGKYSLSIISEDSAGNKATYSKNFEIDKTNPEIKFTGLDKNSYNDKIDYEVTSKDSVTLKINDKDAENKGTLTDEGKYIFVATAEDKAGNKTVKSITVNIDKTNPTITFTGLDKEYNNKNINYTVSSEDPVVLKINGSAAENSGTLTDEGKYIFTATAKDEAGNITEETKTVYIDKTKPEIKTKGLDFEYNNSDINYEVSSSDGVELTINGSAAENSGTLTDENEYKFHAVSTDKAGNTSEYTATIIIDKTKPIASFNDLDYVKDLTQVIGEGHDLNYAGMEIYACCEGIEYRNSTGYSKLSLAEDDSSSTDSQTWIFILTVSDKAGNETTIQKEVVRDNQSPKLFLSTPSGYTNKTSTILATITDSHEEISNLIIKKNGKTYKSISADSKMSASLYEEGEYTISLISRDKAGNTSQKNANFIIDKTSPITKIDGPTGHNKTAKSVSATSNEKGTVYLTVKRDGERIYSGHDSKMPEYSGLKEDGEYEITAYSVDYAGNKSQEAKSSFVVDSTAPEVGLSGIKNKDYSNKAVKITASVNERFYTGTKVTIKGYIDGGDNFTVPFTCTGKESKEIKEFKTNGTYHLTISAVDEAGNKSDEQQLEFTVDTKDPVINITVPTEVKYNSVIAPVISIKDDYFENKTISLSAGKDITYTDKFNAKGGTRTYNDFKKVKENDGTYTLTVKATDKAGNVATQTKTFIVNRYGSTFKTMQLPTTYAKSADDDVVIKETNVSGIESYKCEVSKDAELKAATGVTKKEKENTTTYTVPKENFAEDGVYKVFITSKDKAGNTSKSKGDFSFTVDSTAPVITYSGVNPGKTVKANTAKMYVSATDTLSPSTKINVSVDDSPVTVNEDANGQYALIRGGYNQNIVITATDEAGNTATMNVENVSVSTSKLAFFATHKLLVLVIGLALIAILLVLIVLASKRPAHVEEDDDLVI